MAAKTGALEIADAIERAVDSLDDIDVTVEATAAELRNLAKTLRENDAAEVAKSVVAEVARLDVKEGDLLVVRSPQYLSLAVLTALRTGLKVWMDSVGLKGIKCMLLDSGTDLSVVRPEDMERAGWVRAPRGPEGSAEHSAGT